MELLKRPEHEIIVELCDEVKVLGSQRELYSAFSNIAFNALKYSPAGGEIVVRLRDRGDKVSFSVKDSGIGIDPKHIPRLTERFYRADSARASVISGTGLGLAITKHVLIRHGGELRIQSWPGKGSKFKCTFPKYDG
jgi:two-component system phosphate regulon sensor histidine kinase PhoR